MRRPPATAFLVALLLGLLCAFAAACGEDDRGLLSSGRAENLKEDLDAIDESVAAGRCARAQARLKSLRAEVDSLPRTTDNGLERRLRSGVSNLETQAPEECASAQTTDTQPETQPETVAPETVAPETQETTPAETTPQETTPQETTPQETTPQETTPPADTTPGASGGEEAPTGVVVNP